MKASSRRTTSPRKAPPSLGFDEFYRQNVDRIYRFAQRMCGPEDTHDLVQETFLNAYRGLGQFRGESKPSTWLYRIAIRVCLAMRRRKRSGGDRELSLEELIPTEDGDLQLQIPADGLSPQETVENRELRRALNQAVRALPQKYRLVLVLRDMEGLSAKEVAAIMGLNERAVKSRLHRARLFVRRELSAKGIGSPTHDTAQTLVGST